MIPGDPPVAVAVVSYNTRELLARCLNSLRGDVEAGRAVVWVVDNASSDGSAEMVRRKFPWVCLVEARENLGFGRAVNMVAERTKSRWMVAANADVALSRGALEAMCAASRRHPEAGVVAPRLIAPDGSTQHSVHAFPSAILYAALYLRLHRLSRRAGDRFCLEGWWNADRAREVDWAHGALLLARRDAFDRVGRFDEDQWMYAEDLDLAWRLRRAGWSVRYEPAAEVSHAGSAATIAAFGRTRKRRYMAATYASMAKRRGLAATWTFAAVNSIAAALRLACLTPMAAVARGRFDEKRRSRAYSALEMHMRGLGSRGTLARRAAERSIA